MPRTIRWRATSVNGPTPVRAPGLPFVDGNKRAGAHALVIFLLANAHEPEFTPAELTGMTLSVARGELAVEAVAIWLRQRSSRRD